MTEQNTQHELPGGSTPSQYALPPDAITLGDLMEHRDMDHTVRGIFALAYSISQFRPDVANEHTALPAGCSELQDVIEALDMNFALGNIFKACYRMGVCSHSDYARDMRKIQWFATREFNRLFAKAAPLQAIGKDDKYLTAAQRARSINLLASHALLPKT